MPWLDPTARETSGTSGLEAAALCLLCRCTGLEAALCSVKFRGCSSPVSTLLILTVTFIVSTRSVSVVVMFLEMSMVGYISMFPISMAVV